KVIGKAPPEEIVVTQLPKQDQQSKPLILDKNKLDLLKSQLEEIAKTMDLDSLIPIEIIEHKRKAKELLNPEILEETSNSHHSWVDVLLKHTEDKVFLPFLAKEVLVRLEKENDELNKNNNHQILPFTNFSFENLTEENIKQFYELIEECDKCKFSQSECKDHKSEIRKTIFANPKKLSAYWINNPTLQTCIAKVLVEKYECGEI
ncbi:MAG TPA: hypothetical protein VMX17_14920, partial [Candidatus Glassbacteria bacterium]|nr:hypothetical protein [Candidatus Glassbacteria bacterium]